MPTSTDQPDPRVLAIIDLAQAKARDLGRWDAIHAIYDLLADEIPQAAQNAIGWYLATESWSDYGTALAVLGVDRRDEYGCWCFDIMRELGTWVTWDLGEGRKYGLSQFERWTPPKRPTPKEAPERAYPAGHPTHPIRVYRGPDLPEGMRWFTAAIRGIIEHVATYDAPADRDDLGFVCAHAVADVQQMHPGEDIWLVYL